MARPPGGARSLSFSSYTAVKVPGGPTMSDEIKFAVVDDHPMFRAGVIATLARAGLTCVAEGATREEAVRLAGERAPDVILLDIDRAGGSLSAVRAIAA